jgi:lipopolysaccharide export system protein LptC
MSIARLPVPQKKPPGGPARLSGVAPRHPARIGRIRQRRWAVGLAKRALPVAAAALLAVVALWPELSGDTDRARFSFHRGAVVPEGGQLTDARYHGVDEHDRPYALTASLARQTGPERVDLTDPKGDISLDGGAWMMMQSREGVFMQHDGVLDLSGDVLLYRDDGTQMHTASATMDLKSGAAAGSEMVHVEGPFGTLDAQGFTLTDRGGVVHFPGPGRLLLNGTR